MSTERYLRLVEFAVWVLAAAVAAVVASLVLGFLLGGTLRTAKFVMFVVGFLMFGAGAVAMQPSGPDTSEAGLSTDGDDRDAVGMLTGRVGSGSESSGGITDESTDDPEHRFEARLQEIGPLADHHLPYEHRVGRGLKLFVASLVVLGASLLMEFGGVKV